MNEVEVNNKVEVNESGVNPKQRLFTSIGLVLVLILILFLYFKYKSNNSFEELYVAQETDVVKEIKDDSSPENLLKEISKYGGVSIPNILSEVEIIEKDLPQEFSYITNIGRDEGVLIRAVEFSDGYSGFKITFTKEGTVQDVYRLIRGQVSSNDTILFGSSSPVASVIDFENDGYIGKVELLQEGVEKTSVRIFLITQKS